jgi:hypothetical protein
MAIVAGDFFHPRINGNCGGRLFSTPELMAIVAGDFFCTPELMAIVAGDFFHP